MDYDYQETPEPVDPAWLSGLMEDYNCTVGDASRITHIATGTILRWLRGKQDIPWAAAELLRKNLTHGNF